jgi:large repetitive protein
VISNNTVYNFGGGGIYNNSSLSLTNTTVSGNQAATLGGGIRNQGGTTTLNHSTITGNRLTGGTGLGGGVRINGPTTVILNHSIVAGNTAAGGGPDIARAGTVTSQGYNLLGNNDTVTGQFPAGQPNANHDVVGTSAAPVDPLLGPLQDNGGTTKTHEPQMGSPAIDAGNPAFVAPPATDQRGEARVQGLRIDIGALETAPLLSIGDATTTEGDSGVTAASFVVSLNGASSKTVTVNYTSADGLALAGVDYTAASGTLTFAPGALTQTLTIDLLGELIDEDDETFRVTLSNPTNATLLDAEAIGTIQDNDAAPGMRIADASGAEGDAGTSALTFTVTLTAPSSRAISATYTTDSGSATANEDYTPASGTLTFAPGALTQTLTVDLLGDTLDESHETFSVTLASAINATVTLGEGIGAIQDDDLEANVSIGDVSSTEEGTGTTSVTFTVALDRSSGKPISVTFASADGTATANEDYTPISGTLTFAPGTLTQTLTVDLLSDALDESDETFSVTLGNVVNATFADSAGAGTILDNDAPPALSIDDASITEGTGGDTTATVTVTLDAPSGRQVSVAYGTLDGTAIAGADYFATSGVLAFAPGEVTKTLTLVAVGDTLDEAAETLTISLSAPQQATIADGQGDATINDDDDPPTISISSATLVEGATNASFTVTLSGPSSFAVGVAYATSDGTATAGADYTATSGTLSFAPGTITQTIAIAMFDDTLSEADESFVVTLSAPSNASIATANGSAIGEIKDNDTPAAATEYRSYLPLVLR